jgi:type VI secretion system FHA domain protein
MKLVLHAITLNDSDMTPPLLGQFDEAGGTIGRSDSANMTLPDPARLISRVQANVSFGGSFWLEDVGSANPVVHNGLPLGTGVKVPLKGNDELRIGGYRIIVQIEATPASAPVRAAVKPGEAPTIDERDAPAALPARAGAAPLMDLLGPSAAPDQPVSASNPFADVLGADNELSMPMPGTSRMPPVRQPADPVSQPAGVEEPAEAPAPAPVARKSKPSAAPRVPDASEAFVRPAPAPAAEPARQPARSVEPSDAPLSRARTPAPRERRSPPAGGAPPSVRRAHAPVSSDGSSYSADEIWRGFLEGADVDIDLPRGITPEMMRTVGVMMRAAVEGMLQLIAVRAAAKNELHAPMTMIQVRENNPLKFSPDATVALTQLLQPPGRGFMPGPDAVRDAMIDLQSHQLGTMAGMRAALGGLLERFDPTVLEGRLGAQSMLDTLLPPNRKAKLWELFRQHFSMIRKGAEDDYHELFGKAFVEAYNAAVERLSQEQDELPPKR